ncbi:hypothetical protein [Bacillus cytotoxicus]|uniref:hypothetical protein n=1 Tax=Bacillus cytotoxicus TaxID=580165 RepID=UPI003D7E9E49
MLLPRTPLMLRISKVAIAEEVGIFRVLTRPFIANLLLPDGLSPTFRAFASYGASPLQSPRL